MATDKTRVVKQEITRMKYVRNVQQEQKRCAVCGELFWGGPLARYCGRVCQNKAHYERHAKELRAARMAKYQAEKKVSGKK